MNANVPISGTHQGKLWGQTQLVFCYNGIECHNLVIVKNGFCSIHKHVNKWNRFLIVTGTLEVAQWGTDEESTNSRSDITVLKPGEICDVPPGVYHQFTATEDSCVIEMYWTVLDGEDISRLTKGGIKKHVE